ncbi:LLM class flavin-dependent oxidoreductase [Fodinicola feengrottensis]|uniref:LLM class flavin-dependent oxidoreductase n=1 Tax=Fodinicola feengrottensis TaxID=435914 RepID=UPI0028BEED9F|nr:LLM class flavin-dependent oxidoreductase [Fodinicola feengrottensis]
MDDTVRLWRQLWSGAGRPDFAGRVLHFDDLPAGLTSATPGGPPLWLGGATPAAVRRTGRLYDGWLPYPPDPADYRTGLAAVRTAASEAGRLADDVTPALFVTVLVDEDRERGLRTLDQYCLKNYGRPLAVIGTIQLAVTGSPDEIVAQLRPYVDAGARHLVCRIGALDVKAQWEQLEPIAALPL